MKPWYCIFAFSDSSGNVRIYEHFTLAADEAAARKDFYAALTGRYGNWMETYSKRDIVIRDMTRLLELERGRLARTGDTGDGTEPHQR